MRRFAVCAVSLTGFSVSLGLMLFACSGSSNNSGFPTTGGSSNGGGTSSGSSGPGSSSGGNPGSSSGTPIFGSSNGGGGSSSGVQYTDGGCAGLQCQIVSCPNDGGTTITGKIMDPAGANPLYNVLAYVPMYDPAQPSSIPSGYGIQPITGGVSFPSGVSCDNCSYLYTGDPIAVGVSGTDGTFTITNAPSGTNIPVVVQVGKWRTHTTVSTVTNCQPASAGTIKLPGKTVASDPIISMPQLAISMGGADSLECLPYRMGIDLSEFTAGASASGHIHVFTGGGIGGVLPGTPPASSTGLWDSLTDLEKYDVSLFSCEGSETANANPALLEQYVNAGGRAFLSHYHYAWLAGPLQNGGYTANADWGTNLATWNSGDQGAGSTGGAKIVTTLNVGGGPFQKGQDLLAWLGNVGALGTGGVPAQEVSIQGPSFDPNVTSSNIHSQPWATYDPAVTTDPGATTYPTSYFSFDTPIGATSPPDGGSPPYCGRVVFSGLHVGGAANDSTGGAAVPTSTNCNPGPGQLSPQEKVLEFMIFDLSSCVTPDKAGPGIPIIIPPPPPPK